MKPKNLNLLIAICILLLTGCSSARDSLKTIIENTTPISLNVHEKVNSEILIDISETHQYSLKTIDSVTVLKVYASEVLLFSKEYSGVINQADNAPSVFELEEYFYFVVNLQSESAYLCDLYRVSLLGDQEIILSKHFDFGMNTNFYLDAYDSSFYLSFQESGESQYSLSKYLYDSGGLSSEPASTEYFNNLYLGIRNIIHKSNGDIYICTNNEYVYKNGESQDLFSASQIFQNDDGEVCFYDVSRNQLDNSYYLERRNVDTRLTETFKAIEKFGSSLLYAAYRYQEIGIFILRTPELTTSVKKSIFSVFIYNDENATLSAFFTIDERVANVFFYGSKLYYEAEKTDGDIVFSYIDFANL